jgi:hypothetical protein
VTVAALAVILQTIKVVVVLAAIRVQAEIKETYRQPTAVAQQVVAITQVHMDLVVVAVWDYGVVLKQPQDGGTAVVDKYSVLAKVMAEVVQVVREVLEVLQVRTQQTAQVKVETMMATVAYLVVAVADLVLAGRVLVVMVVRAVYVLCGVQDARSLLITLEHLPV